MYELYSEFEGDNRYKSPHADVRGKFAKKMPLNAEDISYNEFCRLKRLVEDYFNDVDDDDEIEVEELQEYEHLDDLIDNSSF